jgi:hypothetical protein
MKVIGFNFTKIVAEKKQQKITAKPNTSIEFTNIDKEKVELLKDNEALKISFLYNTAYQDQDKKEKQGEIIFEGDIILAVSKDESKDIQKSWKKKQIPSSLNLFLFNLILRRCTPKAIMLEDEISLPFHTPMPRLTSKQKE